MNKKQVFNPYLPSYEYIPDGEPHVFGDRIYLYGSHDRCGSVGFCLNDYICYSADVHDLTEWKYEGVIYKKEQDPRNQNISEDAPELMRWFGIEPEKPEDLNPKGIHAMFAPDVVKGLDGRYYLYYCLDILPEIGVAVCDTPAGKYEFLGLVRHADGTVLGHGEDDYIQFDPGVFIDDDGEIYLYSGNAPMELQYAHLPQASQVMKLQPDMLTLKEEPKKLLPSILESAGTGFEGHEFFEASSIRKVNDTYYFVYSSVVSHELCYAVSEKPDEGYRYGGTLVDIADIGLNGRTVENGINMLGNTHGGMELINGQWYIFYHRQTNRTNFSRQGCAEKIQIQPDGSIPQVEVTSCGLNDGALVGEGTYPARICCHLTGAKAVVNSRPDDMKMEHPFLTQDVSDIEPDSVEAASEAEFPVQYITNIQDGTIIGYKYFMFQGVQKITMTVRGKAKGIISVSLKPDGDVLGCLDVDVDTEQWISITGDVKIPDGEHALYFRYAGSGAMDAAEFTLNK